MCLLVICGVRDMYLFAGVTLCVLVCVMVAAPRSLPFIFIVSLCCVHICDVNVLEVRVLCLFAFCDMGVVVPENHSTRNVAGFAGLPSISCSMTVAFLILCTNCLDTPSSETSYELSESTDAVGAWGFPFERHKFESVK